MLRQALAFPMYGASAWLVWVMSQEAGPAACSARSAGLVLLGFAGWVLGHHADSAVQGRAASVRPWRPSRCWRRWPCCRGITAAPVGAADGAGLGRALHAAALAALRAEGGRSSST